MHIAVACPSCQSTYQVDPSLRGRLMRCPNPLCREVFEVREPGPPQPDVGVEPPGGGPSVSPSGRRPDGPAVPPEALHRSGSVGDVIPILPSEEAIQAALPRANDTDWPPLRGDDLVPIEEEEDVVPVVEEETTDPEKPPPPVEAPSWHQPPPVRRPNQPRPPEPPPSPRRRPQTPSPQTAPQPRKPPPRPRARSTPVVQAPLPDPSARPEEPAADHTPPIPDVNAEPQELPLGAWQAPPVRRPGSSAAPPVPAEPAPAPDGPDHEMVPSLKARRRARWIMAGIMLTVVAVLGSAGWVAWSILHESEGRLREQAQRDYQDGRFLDAAAKYRGLAEKFSDSPHLPKYQFLVQLSDLRADLQGIGADPQAVLERTSQFVKQHAKDPLLGEYGPDLGQSLARLLGDYSQWAVANGDCSALAVLDQARQLLAELDQRLPGSIAAAEQDKLADGFRAVREAVARREEQQQLLDRLHALLAAPSAEAVKEAHQLIKQARRSQPALDREPKVVDLLTRLYQGHRGQVTYTPAAAAPGARPSPPEAIEPSLRVDQQTASQPGPAAGGDRIVLALARGVLYALAASTGDVQWATRVGIDTSTLPLRLPATLANPEMFLVLSADPAALMALDTNGVPLWEHRLSAPCLGRPVIIDLRAYVPTYDGLVHEIELVRGHLLGRYNLGQRLSLGGARQPGTHLLYFPADDYCTYVLNVDPHLDPTRPRCEAILCTGHASGSLRSEPIVTSKGDGPMDGPEGYLILSQTHGLDAMQLRVYGLPLQSPDAQPLAMQPAPQTRGWTWFPPHHDPEKVALVTDAGILGLFGIRQLRNQDEPLFPAVPPPDGATEPGIRLDPLLRPTGPARGRAQIVHAMEDTFWVLVRGKLQRLEVVWKAAGPQVLPARDWPALSLGSPLHSSQVVDSAGRLNVGLLLVTQVLGRQSCLATMVDAEDGRVRWQRQLGLVCQGDPLVLGQDVLAVDQGGGLFLFDPRKHAYRDDLPWQAGGESVARPLEDAAGSRPYLVPDADGRSVYEVAATGNGTNLVVRRFQRGQEGQRAPISEQALEIRAPLAGAPALSAGGLLLPLADGSLVRLSLPLDGSSGVDGPDWRSSRLPGELQAYAAWLNEQDFLTTDGGRGLTRWRWPRGPVWRALPANKDQGKPTLELPARIVSAPVVLREDAKTEPQVCVADAEGSLHLFQVKGDALEAVRRWPLGGRITAGPFVRGRYLGCVVDRRRLVWLDPKQDRPAWEYRSAGEGIVGQPQLIDGLLVVADQSGRFAGLDPATGRPRGPGCTLRANAAPSASPVAFGPNRAFVPLTDGTVLLLSLDRLRDPLRAFPNFP